MSPYMIAQWFVNNPQAWQNFVDNLGSMLSKQEMLRLAYSIDDFAVGYPDDDLDAEDDADALASAGFGTDEDYGGDTDRL